MLGSLFITGSVGGGFWIFYSQYIGVAIFAIAIILTAFMLFFFRDPSRMAPEGAGIFVSGADGLVRAVEHIPSFSDWGVPAVRVSVFLSPFDVHVNRCPMAGTVKKVIYRPGRKLLTYDNRASEVNEHSTILIEGTDGRCVVRQIVGPIVRRVVCWLSEGESVSCGGRLGLMKFGSRLDVYFQEGAVEIAVKSGDRVRAGETIIARATGGAA